MENTLFLGTITSDALSTQAHHICSKFARVLYMSSADLRPIEERTADVIKVIYTGRRKAWTAAAAQRQSHTRSVDKRTHQLLSQAEFAWLTLVCSVLFPRSSRA